MQVLSTLKKTDKNFRSQPKKKKKSSAFNTQEDGENGRF